MYKPSLSRRPFPANPSQTFPRGQSPVGWTCLAYFVAPFLAVFSRNPLFFCICIVILVSVLKIIVADFVNLSYEWCLLSRSSERTCRSRRVLYKIRWFEIWMGFCVYLNVSHDLIFSGVTSFCVKVHVFVCPTIGIFHVRHESSR